MNSKLQVIVLAGGSGKRMQPLLTHKSMFPFLGESMIEHTLENVGLLAPTKLTIVAHPSVAKEIEQLSIEYQAVVLVQKESTGMADAVALASQTMNLNEPVIIVDTTKVVPPQFFKTFKEAIKVEGASIILAGIKVNTYKDGGYFVLNDKQVVTKIIEKPGPDNMPSPYFKLVLDYFPTLTALVDAIAKTTTQSDDHYEQAISNLIEKNNTKMTEMHGEYASLKYAPRVLDVMQVFLNTYLIPGIDPTAEIAQNATISGTVQIAENVKIFENAVIKGPAYIGKNTVIGNGALVRESCIEADCEIGYNTEVARSYIGPRTKCHTSYIGDSIIESDANLAAGTITANLRFDDKTVMIHLPSGRIDTGKRKFGAILAKGVKTGIHASLMPGTVAPPDTIIGTGVQSTYEK